jgi:hypothetical protein
MRPMGRKFDAPAIDRMILLEKDSFDREGVALRMNRSRYAFKFLCENFQPKLINFYSNCQRFFLNFL